MLGLGSGLWCSLIDLEGTHRHTGVCSHVGGVYTPLDLLGGRGVNVEMYGVTLIDQSQHLRRAFSHHRCEDDHGANGDQPSIVLVHLPFGLSGH